MLVFEMIRNVRDDDAFLEEERAFEQERVLIVQELLPPFGRNKLRQDDCHYIILGALFDAVYVAQQGAHERAVRRGQDDDICRAPAKTPP